MAQVQFSTTDLARLVGDNNLWLATVRADGSPHLVPIWFVWSEDKAFICTSSRSVKARNIVANPKVAFSLQDGNDPIVIEGRAKLLEAVPEEVARAFREKYDWDISGEGTYDALIEITPTRVVL